MATKDAKSAKKGNEKKKSTSRFEKDEVSTTVVNEEENTNNSDLLETTPEEFVELVDSTAQENETKPEDIYYEPPLSDMIVTDFVGEKVHGLYEGDGEITFEGGHHYQGQLSEGLMHGKGKYTWSNGLVYEGEFTRNFITGKGMYVWQNGSTYVGDLVNGKRHGFGTFTSNDELVVYTGMWHEGQRHGKGRLDFMSTNDSFYDGDWYYNTRQGFGTRQYPSGNVYIGTWENNLRHGEGMMKWFDCDQIYEGAWDSGIQHGWGQHVWLLRRMSSSQYPLRNMYIGEFYRGQRKGFGTFIFASGARYEGEWTRNIKDGKGKFVFKNGRVYEGKFHIDRIVEYPNVVIDGSTTPDPNVIRTRTPLPFEAMETHSTISTNTLSPSFKLSIDALLTELENRDTEEECRQVMFVILQHMSTLRNIYSFYSGLGTEEHESPDNTYIMKRMQYWRLLKDCHFHHSGVTLCQMDRWLADDSNTTTEIHDPNEKILQRQFINTLIVLAFQLHKDELCESESLLAACVTKLLEESVLKKASQIKGYFYYETRRAINALVHYDQAYYIYTKLCEPRKEFRGVKLDSSEQCPDDGNQFRIALADNRPPHEPSFKMRQFLYMMKDCGLINNDLTATAIINILSIDDPNAADGEGCCNMELEMTFLEFLEALLGCAEVYVTENLMNHQSTPAVFSRESQHFSAPESVDHVAEEGEDTAEPLEPDETKPKLLSSHNTCTASEPALSTAGSEKQTELEPRLVKSGTSFVSSHSQFDATGERSEASIGDAEERGSESDEAIEEELDEDTRAFNFWTHQIHIFFSQKFFPAIEKILEVRARVVTFNNVTVLVEKATDSAMIVASERPSSTHTGLSCDITSAA